MILNKEKNMSEDCNNCRDCLRNKTINSMPVLLTRMVLCIICGNKRCPKATNHRLECTNSNELGQEGSDYA